MTDHRSSDVPRPPTPRPASAAAVVDALASVGPLPVFLSTHGQDGRAEWFNPQWRRFTGQADAAALGWGWLDAVGDEQHDHLLAQWRQGIVGGVAFDMVVAYRRHDGEYREYHLRATPLNCQQGPAPSWVCVHVDAAANSPSLAAHTKAILDSAVDAIVTIDQRGIVRSINPAGERMFGYAAEEIVGQKVNVLMPEPYASEHDGYMQRYLTTGDARIIGIGRESEGKRRDGTRFPIDLAVSEVDLGEERMFTGIVRDLTERKEAERQIKQAERLSTIGQMISTLAHESRNYLQRIHIALESAQLRVTEDNTLGDILGDIERATDALNALLDDVRNYAAPIHLAKRECDLSTVWREAWHMVSPLRTSRLCELHEPPSDPPLIARIDHFRMSQVFRNFFENSLAACPDPVDITVKAQTTILNAKPAIELTVQDNGPGLEPEQRMRVFEPFYTTKARGTGLGMAIAVRVIEAHGGKIKVGDAPRGASFVITLPQ
ncbi:MAG: hypothetical protein CMJ58_13565 [Planctomycetaceae bacterium]|nr:hypothetical protein [Planctomycetaceae bacterium]